MEGRFAYQEVEQRSVVRLDNEEEDLLCRYIEQSGPDYDIVRVRPYSVANQIRVPGSCRDDGNLIYIS